MRESTKGMVYLRESTEKMAYLRESTEEITYGIWEKVQRKLHTWEKAFWHVVLFRLAGAGGRALYTQPAPESELNWLLGTNEVHQQMKNYKYTPTIKIS